MGLFLAYDLEASFKAEGDGQKNRRLVTRWQTTRLGEEAWALGLKAYQSLRTEGGEPITPTDLVNYVKSSKAEVTEFFQAVEKRFLAGEVFLASPIGEKWATMPDWKDADWPWQVKTMGHIVASSAGDNPAEAARLLATDYLVAALCRLDDAVICADLDDVEGLTAVLIDVQWFIDQVDRSQEIEDLATKNLRRLDSRRAGERAAKRHASDPKQAAKAFIRQCWQDWQASPDSYRSTAAFARAMLDKFPDLLSSQPVIERWVRTWKQGR